MGLLSSLNREQKQAIGLLQVGTFLEYFDLMLYVHMAVLLNELFFPKTDPHTASLLAAAAFSITFVFRPIGALVLGWIGDHIGRKSTLIITTVMMATSCLIMANLPTYAQIGIAAAWIVTICRILQGMSSMGEVMGAEIYLTESIERPTRYPSVAFLGIAADLGGFAALGIGVLVVSFGFNWRSAFWFGVVIAIVGAFARTMLRETPEFLEAKRQWLRKGIQETNLEYDPVRGAELNATWKEPVEAKTLLSYFFISCGTPLCFYLAYIYFTPMLQDSFGYTSEDIIKHNCFLALIGVIATTFVASLSYYVHPIKINKIRGIFALFMIISLPFLIVNVTSPMQLFFLQAFILVVALNETPSSAVFLSHFPLYRRFTAASFLFALSRAFMHVITSFGLIYLGRCFNHFGIWFIALPVVFGYFYGFNHFERLERQRNLYPNLS